ncbi:MAG: hypothetical protein IPL52_17145 [Flavobacteriales bacterium]|nr:hypothetical protein [Flavobacteriales bacterium]
MEARIKAAALRFFIYSHLWLALGAAAQTWWTLQFLPECKDPWRLVMAVALGMFALYNWLRVVRASDPGLRAASPTLQWSHDHRKLLVLIAVGGGLSGLLVLGGLLPRTWPVVALAVIPGLLYLLPLRTKSIGLRSIPFLKVLVIVWCWTLACVVLPIAARGGDRSSLLVLAHAFVRVPIFLALAIAFDIRDAHSDPSSVRTIPQVLGVRWAKVLGVGLLLFAAAVVVLRGVLEYNVYVDGDLPWSAVLVAAGLLVGAALVLRASSKRSSTYWSFGLDGLLVLLPLLNWLGGHF